MDGEHRTSDGTTVSGTTGIARRRAWFIAGASAVTLLAALGIHVATPTAICACGGPAMHDIAAAMRSPRELQMWVVYNRGDYDEPQVVYEQLRFLYPLAVANPGKLRDLWLLTYNYEYPLDADSQQVASGGGWDSLFTRVSLAPIRARLEANDLAGAEREARSVIERIIDMPSAQAHAHALQLRRATELVEIATLLRAQPAALPHYARIFDDTSQWDATRATTFSPVLRQALAVRGMSRSEMADSANRPGFTHPRLASLKFVAVQEAIRSQVPDGWGDWMPPEAKVDSAAIPWDSLEAMHHRWLMTYGTHPLADLVRLSQLKLARYRNQTDRAWEIALAMYPRRPARAAGEMIYLERTGRVPQSLDFAQRYPEVLTALVDERPLTLQEWDRWWQLARANPRALWSEDLETRLLASLQPSDTAPMILPRSFPVRDSAPSGLWADLRLVALVAARRWADADSVIASGSVGAAAAPVAEVHLHHRRWSRAASMPALDHDARLYLMYALIPDTALRAMERDTTFGRDARYARAFRLAGREQWQAAAALLDTSYSTTAALWRRAATLERNRTPAGRLAYARFLRANRNALLLPTGPWESTSWYRSVAQRWRWASAGDEPVPAAYEQEMIDAHMRALFPSFHALRAYADYLAKADPHGASAKRVLAEADLTYRSLIDYDRENSPYWMAELDSHPATKVIRAFGRAVRQPRR